MCFSVGASGCLPGVSVESASESNSSQAFRDGRCEYGRCVRGGRSLRWSDHMTARTRFAVEFRGQTNYIKNTHFGALKIKDGIVDFFREHSGQRPSVDAKRPDLRVVAQLNKGKLAPALICPAIAYTGGAIGLMVAKHR